MIDRKVIISSLILLGICGFVLRVHNLGQLGLIVDEGIQALAVDGILQYGYPLVPSGSVYFRSPIFLYLQSFASQIWGMNEFSLRLPGVIVNIFSIGMIYAVGKCLFDRKVALLAAFLLTFSVWEIELSRYGRMYTLFQFFVLLSMFCFYKGFIIDQKNFRLLTPVVFVVTFSIHSIGLSLLTLFLVPLCMFGYKITKKWTVVSYMIVTFIGMVLYHLGIGRLSRNLSQISVTNQSSSEGIGGIAWVLQSVKSTFSLPHIGLLKYQIFQNLEVFLILYGLVMVFVLWLGYKGWNDRTHFGKFVVEVAIVVSASLYQFTLALLVLYVYLFFFYQDAKPFLDSSLKRIVATLILLFGFWSMYSFYVPSAVFIVSISDVFWGFPNVNQFFVQWYAEGFTLLLTVVLIGMTYIFREYRQDRQRSSFPFILLSLPLMILFPSFFYTPWYGSRYTFHLYPILIVIFSFVIVQFGLYLMRILERQSQSARWPSYLKAGVFSGSVVLLAGCLSQDVSPAEVLAVSDRSYLSSKDPIKSSVNWGPYAAFHQDHVTPAHYVKEHLSNGDVILVQSSLHIPPIYYQYIRKLDYVLLSKWIIEGPGKKSKVRGMHYITGSKVISGVQELRDVLSNLKPCQKLWVLTDFHMRDGDFFEPAIRLLLEKTNWTKVYTGKDGKTFVYLLNSC